MKFNAWQLLIALAILVAGVVILILTGHESSLGVIAKLVVWIVGGGSLALLKLEAKPCPPPAAETPKTDPKP
jgi:hypothetical protein